MPHGPVDSFFEEAKANSVVEGGPPRSLLGDLVVFLLSGWETNEGRYASTVLPSVLYMSPTSLGRAGVGITPTYAIGDGPLWLSRTETTLSLVLAGACTAWPCGGLR